MSIRTALTTSLLIVTVFLTYSQLVRPVAAVGSPLTSPVTPPLTAFEAVISGKITIKKIGWWFGNFSNRFTPAADVLVKLVNVRTHETQTTMTNEDGEYEFAVDRGWYKVMPKFEGNDPEIVVPPFHFVFIKKHIKTHVDFHALDLP